MYYVGRIVRKNIVLLRPSSPKSDKNLVTAPVRAPAFLEIPEGGVLHGYARNHSESAIANKILVQAGARNTRG